MSMPESRMVDLHSHILPGLDDGPATFEESLLLAELYVKSGFTDVIATPHWIAGSLWMPSSSEIKQKVEYLNQLLKEKSIQLRIHSGMEVAMDEQTLKAIDKNEILSLAEHPYILIETPFQQLPWRWIEILLSIISRGYRVILAHPERCAVLSCNSKMIDKLIDAGVCFQINHDSILGNFGRAVKESAFYLAEKGYIHCLATDSHGATIRRPDNVYAAFKILTQIIGSDNAYLLTFTNPARVLNGLSIEQSKVNLFEKVKGKWQLF